MKIISFSYFNRPKKKKKFKIFCLGNVFKVCCFVMITLILALIANLLVKGFFDSVKASVENFVTNFVKLN